MGHVPFVILVFFLLISYLGNWALFMLKQRYWFGIITWRCWEDLFFYSSTMPLLLQIVHRFGRRPRWDIETVLRAIMVQILGKHGVTPHYTSGGGMVYTGPWGQHEKISQHPEGSSGCIIICFGEE
jgi:hypothetical protein